MTRRFLLRDFTEAAWPGFLAYHGDPRYLALSGPGDAKLDDTRRLFRTFRDWASEHPRRNFQLAVLRRREPVGCGGETGRAELGIELAPDHWGRHGYAVEIGRALLEFAFGDLGWQEVYGVTVSANARVTRLAEWFGAEPVGTRPGRSGCPHGGGARRSGG